MKRIQSVIDAERLPDSSSPEHLLRGRSATIGGSPTIGPARAQFASNPSGILNSSIMDERRAAVEALRRAERLQALSFSTPTTGSRSIRSFLGELAREGTENIQGDASEPAPPFRAERSRSIFFDVPLVLGLAATEGDIPADVESDRLLGAGNATEASSSSDRREINFELFTAKALEKMHSAILHLDSTKSETEIFLLQEQCTDECDRVMEKLVETLRTISDPVLIHEEILQSKVLLFSAWMTVIQTEVAHSYPETSRALSDVEDAHRALFHDYHAMGLKHEEKVETTPEQTNDSPSGSARVSFSYRYDEGSAKSSRRARSGASGGGDAPVGRLRSPTMIEVTEETTTMKERVISFILAYLWSLMPILEWGPKYCYFAEEKGTVHETWKQTILGFLNTLRCDLVAGITIGIVLVAQAMAYATVARLPLEAGLYCGFVPTILYSFFATSRQAAVGPVAMVSLLTGTAIASLNLTDPLQQMAAASALGFIVGIIMLALGLLRLGFIVNFLSQPLLSGFLQAAAVVIFCSQLQSLFGTNTLVSSTYTWATVISFFTEITTSRWLNIVFGLLWFVLIIFFRWLQPKVPASLISIVLGIALCWTIRLDIHGLVIVGTIKQGLPSAGIPSIGILGSLVGNAFIIFVVGFMEHLTACKNYAKKNGYEVDLNQELVSLGLANVVGSFFGSFPSFAAIARSAINDVSGNKSQVSTFISAIVMITVLSALTFLFYFLPKAVLAATVCAAVTTLFDGQILVTLWRTSKFDLLCLVVTFLLTLFAGVDIGILVAIGFSLVLVVYQVSKPTTSTLGRWPGTVIYRDVNRRKDIKAITLPGITIYRFESHIFFANVPFLKQELYKIFNAMCADKLNTTRALIFDMSAVPMVDSTGISALKEIIIDFAKKDLLFCISSLEGSALAIFHTAGVVELLGENKFFYRIHDAVRAVSSGSLTVKPPPPTIVVLNGYETIRNRCARKPTEVDKQEMQTLQSV